MTYPLPVNFATGSTVTPDILNNICGLVNLLYQMVATVPMLPSAHAATTGTETFTLASGTVTTIGGTTVDGVALSIGDYVLIKDAPSTTGVGSVNSVQPANGLYTVASVGTNTSVARAPVMSATGAVPTPAGMLSGVMAGTVNAGLAWFVSSPNTPSAAFTYGTTPIGFFQAIINPVEAITLQNKRVTKRVGSVTSATANTISINTDSYDVFQITLLASAITTWTITGTPNHGDRLELEITDNGTPQSLGGWAAWAIPSGVASLPNITSASKKITLGLKYDATYSTWVCMATDLKGYA